MIYYLLHEICGKESFAGSVVPKMWKEGRKCFPCSYRVQVFQKSVVLNQFQNGS